jgi:multidrug resistance efflux pump
VISPTDGRVNNLTIGVGDTATAKPEGLAPA